MTDSILIGKIIDNVLRSNLTSYVSDRIWPLVAPYTKPEDMVCPFIIYTKRIVNARTLSKDGYVQDDVNFQIDVVSATYGPGATLANEVRKLFEDHHFSANNMVVDNIHLINISEDFSLQNSKYIQTLTFECSVNNA